MREMDGLADIVVMTVKSAVAPVLERLAVAEAKLAQYAEIDRGLRDLRDRVVATETKAAMLRPETPIDPLVDRLTALESEIARTGYVERRLDELEAKAVPQPDVSREDLTLLRDRLVALETKADGIDARLAAPNPLGATVDKTERALADVAKDLSALRERLAVAEVKTGVPGPPGPAGKDGKDGKDGVDGLGCDDLTLEQTDERSFALKAVRGDLVKVVGTASFPVQLYRDVWEPRRYVKGDCVTWAGSEWHCNEPTEAKPGDGSKAWTLKVKRGRDGRDGKDAPAAPPVVSIGGGRG